MDTTQEKTEEGLRTPPRDRFAHAAIEINTHEIANTLRKEPIVGDKGHQQIAIYKNEGITAALFHFKEGAKLKEHLARGSVIIHALEGELLVHADGKEHHLTPGQMVILAPSVPHDVHAIKESMMMLTVSMSPQKA